MENMCRFLQMVVMVFALKIVLDSIFYLISLPFGGCKSMYYSRQPNVFCLRYTCNGEHESYVY
jgi:hypothetical protein